MKSKEESKVKQYIEEDRPKRLKTFVTKHELNLSAAILKHDQNLLHFCCKHGSGSVLRYLLLEGVQATLQDNHGKCPLHLALERALKHDRRREHDQVTDCYTELIMPLLEKHPECLDMRDLTGQSCRQLLQELVDRRESKSGVKQDSCMSESSPEPGDLNDQEWQDKLADELQHEYSTTWGQYEPDYDWTEREEEACGDWADRIREEYRAKKKAQQRAYYMGSSKHSKQKESKKKQDTTSSGSDKKYGKETLGEARERMRKQFDAIKARDTTMEVLKLRMKYEERYKTTLDSCQGRKLKYEDIPWPSTKGENCDMNVLFDQMDSRSVEYKKYRRDQQIRWHPDKFLQRFGDSLVESDRQKVMDRVTMLSQNLNK